MGIQWESAYPESLTDPRKRRLAACAHVSCANFPRVSMNFHEYKYGAGVREPHEHVLHNGGVTPVT